MQENIFVYAALAAWRGVKDAPKTAKNGVLSYDAACLYDDRRGEPVAWPIGKGKRRAIVIGQLRGQRYGSWGRTSECVADMVQRAIDPSQDGIAIVLPFGRCPRTVVTDWPRIAEDCARNNHVAEAYAVARAIGMAISKLPRPALAAPSFYRNYSPSNLERALDELNPVKIKAKRARERKVRRYNDALRAFECSVAQAVNRDRDYQIATAACSRNGPSVSAIATALGLPLNAHIKFVMPDGRGSQQHRHQYTADELSGLAPTAYVEPAICRSGYHFTTIKNWYNWAKGDCYLVKPETPIADVHGDKAVAGSIRFARKLGSAADIQRDALGYCETWDARYGADPREARSNIINEYRSFMIAPKRSDFGLED